MEYFHNTSDINYKILKMRHIESCFFCASPYQIIAAISIVRGNCEPADLYVLFDGAEKYIKEIRKENIFSKVVFVKKTHRESSCSINQNLNILRSYMQCSKIAQEILIPNTIYEKFYFSSDILPVRCCYFYFIKKNVPIKRIMFDDGAGSYLNDYYVSISKKDEIIRRLLFGNKALEKISDKILYIPDLYTIVCKSPKCEVEKINGDFNNFETRELFNRIFQFKESDLIKENIILLDSMNDEILDKTGQQRLRLLYKKIFQTYGVENIIVKPHPRDNAILTEGIRYYTNYKLPLECLYMNINCNEKILITVSSTAVVTPKLLFDQEPYVILLYRLLNIKSKNMSRDDLDVYYKNCKRLYSHPERFMIPKNEKELDKCLRKIRMFL